MVMKGAALLMLLTCVEAYQLILHSRAQHLRLVTGQIILTICTALYGGNMAIVLVELFPAKIRYTGMGISYNLCNAIVAGTTTIAQSYLVMTDELHVSVQWLTDTSGRYYWCSPMQALFADRRLHAAFYLQCVSVLAIFSLSLGIASCNRKGILNRLRKHAVDRETAASSSHSSVDQIVPHLTQIYIQRG